MIYDKRRDEQGFPRSGRVAPRDFTKAVGPSETQRRSPTSPRSSPGRPRKNVSIPTSFLRVTFYQR